MPDPLSSATSGLVVELNPQGTSYLYVTLVDDVSPRAAAVDGAGNLWIAGQSASPQPVSFLAKIDPNGSLLFSKAFGVPAQSIGQAILITPKARFW